jgi:predicted nucleic-acid-binding protein
MIGLDTNVLVRYLVQDDPLQSASATKLIENSLSAEEPGYVTLVTLAELEWVLEDCYGADRQQVYTVIEGLLMSRQLRVENPDVAWRALRAWDDSKADLSDAIIGQVSLAAGCERIATFDRAASKLDGFTLLR